MPPQPHQSPGRHPGCSLAGTPARRRFARISGLVQFVAGVALDPHQPGSHAQRWQHPALATVHGSTPACRRLFPAAALPAGHPLGEGINHILAIAIHHKLTFGHVRGCLKQVKDSLQLTHIVGAMFPAPSRPVIVVNIPGPSRRAGVAQRRTVSSRNNLAHALDFTLPAGTNSDMFVIHISAYFPSGGSRL